MPRVCSSCSSPWSALAPAFLPRRVSGAAAHHRRRLPRRGHGGHRRPPNGRIVKEKFPKGVAVLNRPGARLGRVAEVVQAKPDGYSVILAPNSTLVMIYPQLNELLLRCSRCGGRCRIGAVYAGGQRLRDLLDRLGLSPPPGLPPPQRSSDRCAHVTDALIVGSAPLPAALPRPLSLHESAPVRADARAMPPSRRVRPTTPIRPGPGPPGRLTARLRQRSIRRRHPGATRRRLAPGGARAPWKFLSPAPRFAPLSASSRHGSRPRPGPRVTPLRAPASPGGTLGGPP